MLQVEGLSAAYGVVPVLRSLSFVVPERSAIAVIGSNGAGKTTLLRCISSQLKPLSGEMIFDGRRIKGLKPHQVVSLGIAHVPEGRQIFAKLTVRENLRVGAYLRRDGEVEADMEQILDRFPVLRQRALLPAGSLSGGEQQMLAIGRGLMSRPKLLMLDEPSMGLAPRIIEELLYFIEHVISGGGVSVLLVEQNAALAFKVASYVYVLERGEITLSGTPEEIASQSDWRAAYFGK
ncbi:MAG: ABC transporter ATP-binding protein [Ardenticatenaceae bacterium]|nr:ABC transporter ATP-binding protein [Ardenticatenaceae bacterium]HBY93164.1 ABC transporter ATP-binding protein [Chloroflexota bacterium]